MTSNTIEAELKAGASGDSGAQRIREWVRRAQNGDTAAFEAVVNAFSGRMYNLAYRISGNAEDAADLTQEIFVKLYRTLDKFAWRSSFSTWLYALAANTCRSGMRRLRRISSAEVVHLDAGKRGEPNPASADTIENRPGPSENAEMSDLADKIHAAIGELDEDFRLAIVLRDIQGLSYDEIAEVVGCSIGTVKSRLARARLKVRDMLTSEGLTCSVMK